MIKDRPARMGTAPAKPLRLIALGVAIGLDAAQLALFPLFGEGFASPASDVLDCLAFIFFWRLIGWHIALLPSFIIKIIPVLDLAPTWTIAVLIATRPRQGSPLPVSVQPTVPTTTVSDDKNLTGGSDSPDEHFL